MIASPLRSFPSLSRPTHRRALLVASFLFLAFALPAAEPAATPTPAPAPAVPAPPAKLFALTFTTGPAWDAAKPPNEQKFFAEHSANLARLRREGLLVLGARYADKGLVILRVADEPAARAALMPDPSVAGGLFTVTVDEFRPFYHGTTATPLTTPEAIALRAYLDAFNRHDADAVAAFCTEDVKWFSIEGDKLSPETTTRTALRDYLVGYFKNFPDVRSDFLSLEQTGPFLSVRERPSWTGKDGAKRSQQAHGIYEIRAGLIARVWYFPSARDR